MTVFGRRITDDDMISISSYMNDDIREDIHSQLAPCTNEEFIRAYLDSDPDFSDVLESEFDFCVDGIPEDDLEEVKEAVEELREADAWTDGLINKLRWLADVAGIDHTKYADLYYMCIDIQNALGVDLGE